MRPLCLPQRHKKPCVNSDDEKVREPVIDVLFLSDAQKVGWNESGRATLCDFVHSVVDTRLKLKILDVFLCDPYLCLSSLYLSHRLGEQQFEVQQSARELCACKAFLYCESFAYSDLCYLSFSRHTKEVKHCLCLLRFALRVDPDFVWTQVEACGKHPIIS